MNSPSPFIVAEMSANHLGSEFRAHEIIEMAASCGADAIKVQVWSPDTMVVDRTLPAPAPWGGTLFDLYRQAWTPWEWLPRLFETARSFGLVPFGAAFDCESVDFLETLGVDRHKVASFELTDLPLIRYMASKGKPLILSTGMAIDAEIQQAWLAARDVGNVCQITYLRCTSAYPADASDANLSTYAGQLKHGAWGVSDHSMGLGVACAAAALGATYIEKHLTLSRAGGGPDAGFSMEPAEFAQMVTECRRAAAAIGEVRYGPTASESTELRRSLWVVKDISKGETLRLNDNVRTARPAHGLPPSFDLTCKRAACNIASGTALTKEMVS